MGKHVLNEEMLNSWKRSLFRKLHEILKCDMVLPQQKTHLIKGFSDIIYFLRYQQNTVNGLVWVRVLSLLISLILCGLTVFYLASLQVWDKSSEGLTLVAQTAQLLNLNQRQIQQHYCMSDGGLRIREQDHYTAFLFWFLCMSLLIFF